jgi:hypothetical protein
LLAGSQDTLSKLADETLAEDRTGQAKQLDPNEL